MKMKKRPIKGYEKLYAVTVDGRVWSYPKKKGYACHDGMWLSIGKDTYGYSQVSLNLNGKRISHKVHRLVIDHFSVKNKGKAQVNHKNGIKTDNRIENLEWVTAKENIKHAYSTGLISQRGISNNNSKLDEKCVQIIRRSDLVLVELARIFNVTPSLISYVKKNKIWKHVSC